MSSNERPLSESSPPDYEPGEEPPLRDNVHTQFLKEACILLLGVGIGFLWHMYFSETSQEAHLVVMLSIVILCMVRYIYLIQRSRG
jgi:hypothetical protein